MKSLSPEEALKIAVEKRILNEFGSKILNEERLDKVLSYHDKADRRLAVHSVMSFHCECDDATCEETIELSTEEYVQMHHKTKQFIVVPSHVRLDLEEIISSFGKYALVAKYFPHTNFSD
ncbi:hypothetical protein HJC99_05435 [Candidatus Saccharibacteria bacterium]|nr:hypothetical protein [Candidatus Saccharibacteria bacterium]